MAHAQGVGPETAILPGGRLQRVHRVQSRNTNDRVGYCLAVADLFMSKAAAGRDKDREFCMCVFRFIVTARFGIVTAEFGDVTDRFGDVTDDVLKAT